jgi:UDP-glucose 4-epimerase
MSDESGQCGRVLITGASGLVGGRLIQSLLESTEIQVRAASRIERTWPGHVEGCLTDFADPKSLAEACRDVDAVVNLATMCESACAAAPAEALRANAGGMLALATAATAAGVRRLVHLSTAKVYGIAPKGVVTEETLTDPASHYAITHRFAEIYAASQHRNAVVLRLANGFGAPVNALAGAWVPMVNGICREAVESGTITIHSSGLGTRDFIPMNDIVRALRAALGSMPAGTYNLGAGRLLSLREMAEQVAQICAASLGFRPEVMIGVDRAGVPAAPLDFRVTKLAQAGITACASSAEEIALTLQAARRAFVSPDSE